MPNCGCSKVCGCFVAQNGAVFISETDFDTGAITYLATARIGWRDNVVDGNGRATNPYTVSFRDSLEYRPRAQEWRQTGPNYDNDGWVLEPTVYSTPIPNATFVWAESDPAAAYLTASGVLIGAWINVNTGGVAGPIEMNIFTSIADFTGPLNIAGASTQSSDPNLACAGYLNPVDSATSVASSGITATIVVQLFDQANVIVGINDIRLWAVEV